MLAIRPTDFGDVRPQFEAIAREVAANPGEIYEGIIIDGIKISNIQQQDDGNIYFVDAKRSAISEVGWVYAPNGRPDSHSWIKLEHIDGPWYRYEYGR